MNKEFIIGWLRLVLAFLLLLTIGLTNAFIINADDGCSECWQSWSNEYGTLSVYPRTSNQIIRQKQFWYIDSNITADVDVVFRFDYQLSYGGLYFWNGTNYNKVNFEHLEYGSYHYYYYEGFNVLAGINYSGFWEYDTLINTSGKWDLFIKLSTDPIGTWRIHLDPYWDSAYGSRTDLYVNHSMVDSTLTNFPVRVYINGNSHMNTYTQPDLDDVVFVNSANTTVLNYELVNYTKTGGKLYANYYVNITSISSSVNTHFNMYYNNSGATSQENISGVWDSNYICVLHAEDSDTELLDTTSNGNDFSDEDSPDYQVQGLIGYGVDLDGINDYFANDVMNLKTLTETSIEMFYSPDDISGAVQGSLFCSKYDDGNDWRCIYTADNPNTDVTYVQDDGTEEGGTGSGHTVKANEWYFYGMTSKNSGSLYGFWNDTVDFIDSSVNFNYNGLDNKHRIGARLLINPSKWFDGTIDEFRLSNIQRSNAWMNATFYTNINVTGDETFIIWGQTEDYDYPPTLLVTNIFPLNNSYYCNNILNLTNLSVHVECPYGTSFNIKFTFLGETYYTTNLYNGTYNLSLLDKIPIGTTNYTWILNITSNYCDPIGGVCYYNGTFYFNVCWGALTYMHVSNLDFGVIDTAQFFIILMFISWLIITLLNYIDINNPEIHRNKLLGIIHVLFSAPLIFYFAYSSYIDGLLYGYLFTLGFIITTFYIVSIQSLGD